MLQKDVKIGLVVVRSKGDYVVGRTGTITEIDEIKGRARVAWKNDPRTWVKFEVIEDASLPYEIKPGGYNPITGRKKYPEYIRK